jgi:hypothetical protein
VRAFYGWSNVSSDVFRGTGNASAVLERAINRSAQTGRPIEIRDPMNEKPPFVIDVHEDTVTINPFCAFGLDYVSTASSEDLERQPAAVFAEPIEAIADFVAGRTVVSVARRRWWFLKAGWCVGFIPAAEAEEARRTGATVIRWPPAL